MTSPLILPFSGFKGATSAVTLTAIELPHDASLAVSMKPLFFSHQLVGADIEIVKYPSAIRLDARDRRRSEIVSTNLNCRPLPGEGVNNWVFQGSHGNVI